MAGWWHAVRSGSVSCVRLPHPSAADRRRAVARGLRAAFVTFTGFAVGLWVLGSIEVAVFAGFTGIAITGIADFKGSGSSRAAAVVVSTLLGVSLVTLGTLMSGESLAAQMAVTFLVVAGVAFVRVLGGHAVVGADAVTLFYLVAVGSPTPLGAVGCRVLGVAGGGALALLVTCLQPASRRTNELSRELSHLLREAVVRLDLLAEPTDGCVRSADAASNRAAGSTLRRFIDGRADRPSGPLPSQRAVLYLVNDLERLDGLMVRLEETVDTLTRGDRTALVHCARRLADAAQMMDGAWQSDGNQIRTGSINSVSRRNAVPRGGAFGLTARLAFVVSDVVDQVTTLATAKTDRQRRIDTDGIKTFGVHALRRVRANLQLRSVYLRDAVRLGLGLMVTVLTVHLLQLQHGFWVALATLSVVKSDARRTGRSLIEAVIGTVVGFGIASLVIVAVGSRPGWLAVILPLTLFGAFYAKGALSFLAGQAAFTTAVLVMFDLLAPFGWSIGVIRIEDVVAGAVVGLVVGVLAWPQGARASIRWATADLVEASSAYLIMAVRMRTGSGAAPGVTGRHEPTDARIAHGRQSALNASVLADDVLAEFLEENVPVSAADCWAGAICFGNRLWYAGDVVTTALDPATAEVEGYSEMDTAARLLEDRCGELVTTLRLGREGELSPHDGPRRSGGVASVELELWLCDLGSSARDVTGSVGRELRRPQ